METRPTSVSNLASLHHVCFLVDDLEKSAASLARSLSVRWNIWTIEPQNCLVHDESSPFSIRLALAEVGDGIMELIAPLRGESVYGEHLRAKGEGFHHMCFSYPDLASMQAARDMLLEQGYTMIQQAFTQGQFEFCYFKLDEADIVLELLYLKELPKPEKTIGS
jgi:catechol 2,3-dioxygenase-like lactoylglutathione lyase family enzyme